MVRRCGWWFPVRWELFGFEWVVHPRAPGTGTRLGALEENQHLAHVVTPLAIADLLLARSIGTPCLGIDWLLISNLAAGAINPHAFSRDRLRLQGFGCATRRPHLREQLRPARRGAIRPPGWRGPDDGAVGQLFVTPPTGSAMEGFEPVVFSAVARQIPWHRQAAGGGIRLVERDGVVDSADGRGAIASREPARDVAAPDPAFQRGRG